MALVSTAEAVKQAADAKQKAVTMDMSLTDVDTVRLSLTPGSNQAANQDADAEPVLSDNAVSSFQPAAAKRKGDKPYAPGTGKRSDLTFLDPMNKADCPPTAIAVAAGELVLRMREEKRRREAGGISADPPLPSKRMCGSHPGTLSLLPLWSCLTLLLLYLAEATWCYRAPTYHCRLHVLSLRLLDLVYSLYEALTAVCVACSYG